MRSIACVSGTILDTLRERFAAEPSSVAALPGVSSDAGTVLFVDGPAILELDRTEQSFAGPVIAICDDAQPTAVSWLTSYPWLSHVINTATFRDTTANALFESVVTALATNLRTRVFDWIGELTGRRIRLTRASERAERVERMATYFASQGVEAATIQLLNGITDKLLVNAFYQGPLAAGAIAHPIGQDTDVEFPEDSACDLVYGCTNTLALIRVRDPFGTLPRTQIVWDLFSKASLVAISVANQHHTDVLIGFAKESDRHAPFAFHVFFKDSTIRRFWTTRAATLTKQGFAATITTTETR